VAVGDLCLGFLGLGQRLIRHDDDECIVMGIDRRDPVEQRARPFHRRKLPGAQ
jgi:hypothetical protein